MRGEVQRIVSAIQPFDRSEASAHSDVLSWIASGAELCRLEKPATPEPHLVSYVALVDGGHILLGAHNLSGLWLPCGGHVEPGEHPRDAALREAREELNIEAELRFPNPVFLTMTKTVGAQPHRDVSLWYVVRGDRHAAYDFDRREYTDLRWFPFEVLPPPSETDPELHRFCRKLETLLEAA